MTAPRSKGHRLSPAGRLALALLLEQGRATGSELMRVQRQFYPQRSAGAISKTVYALTLYGLSRRVPDTHPMQYELTDDGRTVATKGHTHPTAPAKAPSPKPRAIVCEPPGPATARVKWVFDLGERGDGS